MWKCFRWFQQYSFYGGINHVLKNKIKKVLKNCDIDCYSKYKKIYDLNEKNKQFEYEKLKNDLNNCVNKCDMIYKQVLDHQIKGAEISYVNLIQIIIVYISKTFEKMQRFK